MFLCTLSIFDDILAVSRNVLSFELQLHNSFGSILTHYTTYYLVLLCLILASCCSKKIEQKTDFVTFLTYITYLKERERNE